MPTSKDATDNANKLVHGQIMYPRQDQLRVRRLAKEIRKRVPETLSHLIRIGLDHVELRSPSSPQNPIQTAPTSVDLLARLIIASRFPGENGSTRFRLVIMLQLISWFQQDNKPATPGRIAKLADTHRNIITRALRTLEERGAIERNKTLIPGLAGRPDFAVSIRSDGIEAYDRSHVAATGRSILGASPDKAAP